MSPKRTHLLAMLLARHKINHKLTCDDNCLIYLLSCKCCGKQYVGETTDSFRYRWNNYKDNDRKHSRKESCMQEHLFKHFNSMGHNGFLNNVSITLIDKTDGKNPKKREDYWRRTLKTYSPHWTVSDQPHIAKDVVYWLPLPWILVSQVPFMNYRSFMLQQLILYFEFFFNTFKFEFCCL